MKIEYTRIIFINRPDNYNKLDPDIAFNLISKKFCCQEMSESFGFRINFGGKDYLEPKCYLSKKYSSKYIDYCPWCSEKITCIEINKKRITFIEKEILVKDILIEKIEEEIS